MPCLLAHQERLRALVSNLLLDDDSVEDVLQEVWLAALMKRPGRLRILSAWLTRVAKNLALLSRRERIRRKNRERIVSRREAISQDALEEERQEVLFAVTQAVSALDEPYRTLVTLRFFEGLTISEIADRQENEGRGQAAPFPREVILPTTAANGG